MGKVNLKGRSGFTLIELAIVLVIIGLILGAVLKGRDLIESAKIKKAYTQFIEGWELAIENYQDRTGQLLGDGTKNGGTTDPPDGKFDSIYLAKTENCDKIVKRLKAVGLSAPTTNTGNPGTYFINAKYGRATMEAGLYPVKSNTDNTVHNVIYIHGVPTDVAIALDTIIDGTADGQHGLFRRRPDNSDWPDASQEKAVNVMYIYK